MRVQLFHKVLCICGAAVLLLGVSCSKQQAPVGLPADAVAMIGTRIITVDDLAVEAARRKADGLSTLAAGELLDRMMLREAMLMKGRAQGFENDPEVQREIERVLVARLRDRELTVLLDSVDVTDDELEQAYSERLETFTKPQLDRMAVLYLTLEKNSSDAKRAEVRARMDEARRSAVALMQAEGYQLSKGFDKLPIQYSDDAVSRYRGGDLGWMNGKLGMARIPSEIVQQALTLPLGELSEILETEQGLYLVVRTDERASIVTPFEQARDILKRHVLAEKRTAQEERYYSECLKAADPKINQDVLAKLVAPAKQEVQANEEPAKFTNGF